MYTNSSKNWGKFFATLLLLALLTISLSETEPALAASCGGSPCFRGYAQNYSNYGSQAVIGTPNSFTNPNCALSFELVNSRAADPFVQTGWGTHGCGPLVLFWESQNGARAIPYNNGFRDDIVVIGDNSYANELNNAGEWCHGFNGDPCFMKEYNSSINLYNPTTISEYGETSDTTAQMGGPSGNQAIYLSAFRYKPNINSTYSNWGYVQTAGNSYGSCSNPCPYGLGYAFSASNLYIYNYGRGS